MSGPDGAAPRAEGLEGLRTDAKRPVGLFEDGPPGLAGAIGAQELILDRPGDG